MFNVNDESGRAAAGRLTSRLFFTFLQPNFSLRMHIHTMSHNTHRSQWLANMHVDVLQNKRDGRAAAAAAAAHRHNPPSTEPHPPPSPTLCSSHVSGEAGSSPIEKEPLEMGARQ